MKDEEYEWITVDLLDPTNEKDFFELNILFFEEEDFFPYIDFNINSPFVFLIHKFVEKKGPVSKKESFPIGFIFLHNNDMNSDIKGLDLYIGIKHDERRKGYMSWALDILNYKIAGATMESDINKREYESLLAIYPIFFSIKCDSYLNKTLIENGELISNDSFNNKYLLHLNQEKVKCLQKKNINL